MPKELLTIEEVNRRVMAAMGAPTSSALGSFQKFLANRGNTQMTQPNVPRFPTDKIKKLPLRTQ